MTDPLLFSCHPGKFGNWGRYVPTIGLWEIWRRATVYQVTEKSVTFRSGILFKRSKAVPVRMIQDVSVQTAPLVGRIVLSSAGGQLSVERTLWLSRDDAHRLSETILSLIKS